MRRIALLALLLIAGCASSARTIAIRLHPGDDLRLSLERITKEHNLRAAYIATCVGSLRSASIRFANQSEAQTIEGPFEIVSLTGTLSPDGPHLHISLSDARGTTIGGHLAAGSIVFTTAEIVIVEVPRTRFSREIDAATGSRELVIR